MITFEWNEAKSRANLKKHGVSFEEAQSVFFDEYALQFYDDEHSSEEDRFVMLGMSNLSRVPVVCHCERASGEVIRIISLSPKSHEERTRFLSARCAMKAEYDFSKMKSRKNPYASKLKKSVTIRLGEDVIEYFKEMAEETGIPYQSLINLYLRDCVAQHREIDLSWQKKRP